MRSELGQISYAIPAYFNVAVIHEIEGTVTDDAATIMSAHLDPLAVTLDLNGIASFKAHGLANLTGYAHTA
jgi:hypothetical protein